MMTSRYLSDHDQMDLECHDAPHPIADMEQWHVTCHVRELSGAELSIFAVFYRMGFPDPVDGGRRSFAHGITWSVSDPESDEHHSVSMVDRSAVAYLRQRLSEAGDLPIARALAEVLERGQIPLPDRLMEAPPVVAPEGLHLSFDGCELERTNGRYDVTLAGPRQQVACQLHLRPQGSPVRHGTDGPAMSRNGEGEYHHSLRSCAVSGRLDLPDGRSFEVVEGTGWFDHQFGVFTSGSTSDGGGHPEPDRSADAPGPQVRTSTNITLTDGRAVSAYEAVDPSTRSTIGSSDIIVVDVDGAAQWAADVRLEPRESWLSPRTFREYSTAFHLVSKELDVHLDIDAWSSDREFLTALSPSPPFWGGPCTVRGTVDGAPVSGRAFVVQRRVDFVEDIDAFLRRVGETVIAAVEDVLPHRPTGDVLHNLVGTTSDRQVRDIDGDLLGSAITTPIRSIVDRGGKAWRSYIMLAFCEAVGGDSRSLQAMLAVPEIVHAGSLIIDDIEDGSTSRRGGPACHVEVGHALAINAANAAYFVAPATLMSEEHVKRKPARVKLELYELYFRAMRGAHAGQAMDLVGLDDLTSSAAATGETRLLEERILACYRLKTGVPAACFAAMGAVLGGGTRRQVSAVTHFMEEAGVAFQIIDDILNLTGFDREQKMTGEDVLNGTITLPLVRAFKVLDRQDRQALWSMYQAASDDPDTVPAIVDILDRAGSFDACRALAHDLTEQGWAVIEKELEPSHATVMLRAFSWFVLERHH